MIDLTGFDDTPEPLDPAIYVEPPDRLPDSEDARQAVFVATMRRALT